MVGFQCDRCRHIVFPGVYRLRRETINQVDADIVESEFAGVCDCVFCFISIVPTVDDFSVVSSND